MEQFTIERVGLPNLDFAGELIGANVQTNPGIRIYRTKAGQYVGAIRVDARRSNVGHFATPDLLIRWFKDNAGGQVTPDVQVAIEAATTKDDGFKKAWNEHIE
jgi:hypothetical protein